jgi:hypothetical protein
MTQRIGSLFLTLFFILVSAGTTFSQPPCITLDNISREMVTKFDRSQALLDPNLLITSIEDQAVIPNNFLYPWIEWQKPEDDYEAFLIELRSRNNELDVLLKKNQWQPEGIEFEKFLKEKEVRITLYGLRQEKTFKGQTVRLAVSERSLKDRIAFRVVQPLFDPALPNAIKIFSFEQMEPSTLVEMTGTCIGCHSYSAHSAFFNIKKGARRWVVTGKKEDPTFQWNRKSIGEYSFIAISPDGKYAAFAKNVMGNLEVKKTITEPFDYPYHSGDIYWYEMEKDTLLPLKGASEPNFVEDMPFFSPDGKYLLFSRYQYGSKDGGQGVLSMDLYKVPFNDGRGGEPIPIPHASSNNLYQYFPRYAPNGKWISFSRGDGFKGIYARKSSDIYLLSVDGNTVIRLNLNRENVMDSWHDWSSDSHWLLFSSNREKNRLTALFMVYIDENGKDYPPIKLVGYEHLKINTPQFVSETLNLEKVEDLTEFIGDSSPASRKRRRAN